MQIFERSKIKYVYCRLSSADSSKGKRSAGRGTVSYGGM